MKWRPLLVACAALVASRDAGAFCGFFVESAGESLVNGATQVALMREGTRTVLSMQNDYQGPPSDFAMVVPVPVVLQKHQIKTLPRELFARLEQLSAPRLVEYWEHDPCKVESTEDITAICETDPAVCMNVDMNTAARTQDPTKDLGVKIEAQFFVGEYDIVILSARDSMGLDTWLRQSGYKIPRGAEAALAPYVAAGMKFFVARVNARKVRFEGGRASLSPLRFDYDSLVFSLPVRLGLLNSGGTQDLIVYVLSRQGRYEVANYNNTAVPTNLDVAEATRGQFGAFYAALFDQTLANYPRSVITEYAWATDACDPCPTLPLAPAELAALGADALPSSEDEGFRSSQAGGYALTRLHARYGKESLGDDLVFSRASPIEGGREPAPPGARPSSTNNFQARYAIRHRWRGPVGCEKPSSGRWGEMPADAPPGQPQRSTPPQAATSLASAPRGSLRLASLLEGNHAGLYGQSLSLGVPQSPFDGPGAILPKRPGGGCAGCSAAGAGGAGSWLWLLALAGSAARRARPALPRAPALAAAHPEGAGALAVAHRRRGSMRPIGPAYGRVPGELPSCYVMKNLAALLLVTASVALGCQDRPPTAVVVAVSSEVPVPEGVNELSIEVTSGGEQKFSEVYAVGVEAGQTRLPGTIALHPAEGASLDSPVTVTVRAGLKGGGNRVVRKATMSFVEAKQKLLRMPLRFACLDFPAVCRDDQTCKAGACVPAATDLGAQPDFDESQASDGQGDAQCFDREACVTPESTAEITEVFRASTDEVNCSVSVEELAARTSSGVADQIRSGKGLNFGFVWAAHPEGDWTAVDQDKDEGWSFTDASKTRVALAPGLCDVVRGRRTDASGASLIKKAIVDPTCAPKPAALPECAPKVR